MSHNNSNSITNTNTSSSIQNDTSNMNITSQDHTTFSGMPSKEQVEGVVRAVFKERIVNNMNHDYDPEWVEEIVDFLQKRINLKNETSKQLSPTPATSIGLQRQKRNACSGGGRITQQEQETFAPFPSRECRSTPCGFQSSKSKAPPNGSFLGPSSPKIAPTSLQQNQDNDKARFRSAHVFRRPPMGKGNDEFEPRGSPVITPDKMYTFYRKFRVDKELYPFQRIFDTYSRKSLYALRRLFKDLQCEYFAVNSGSRDADRPSVAALSPKGFVDWMVTFMQATPDIEARRLSRVVATLPIAAADANTLDGRLQRLPKQLSRHLFPSRPHDKTRQWVSNAVMDWDQTMSQVEWLSVSWTTAFCDALCRSLSPAFRGDSGRGDSRRKRCTRTERASYVEVPSSKPQNRSPRQQKSDGRGERPMRDVIRTYVEGSSPPRHLRDASPSRQHYVRDRRYRRSEPKANRQRHAAASPAHESSCASSLHSRNTAQVTSPPSRTAEPLNRVDNYALFQGRSEMGPGPTYEEFLPFVPRGKARAGGGSSERLFRTAVFFRHWHLRMSKGLKEAKRSHARPHAETMDERDGRLIDTPRL
ncbi:hypothetical protein RJ55_02407 [Drechmeria coniospora]|nr:hypothetical protein RJ55_02407 [Drechmeria coniospora]